MKIDLVFPWPIFWNMGYGWVSSLKKLGLLNKYFPMKLQRQNTLFDYLPRANSDLIIFLCADQHMPYLHDEENKRRIIRSAKAKTLCYANESIVDTPFSEMNIPRGDVSRNVYQYFLCADEQDLEFFSTGNAIVAWCPQFADADKFRPLKAVNERSREAFFFGQTTTFGLGDRIYKDRRLIIENVNHLPGFRIISNYVNTSKSPQKLIQLYNKYLIALCLPTNVGSYTNRIYEAAGCGNLIFHYHIMNRPQQDALFEDGVDYIRFERQDLPDLIEKVRFFAGDYEIGPRIAASARAKFVKFHSIEQRIRQIVQHVEGAKFSGIHNFEFHVPAD